MDFKKMQIKALSKQALSKLKRGLPARIMEGNGMRLSVMPHQYNAISKSFSKKKGMNITLSPPEVEANMDNEISGEGIFGKKADKWFEKKGIKQAVYSVGSALKPLAMEAIDMAGAAAIAYGVPAPLVTLAQNETKGYIDNPDLYQTKKGQNALLKRTTTAALDTAAPYLDEAGFDVQKVKDAGKLAAEMKRSKRRTPQSDSNLKNDAEESFLSTLEAFMNQYAGQSQPSGASSAPAQPPRAVSTNPWDLVDSDGMIGNGIIQDIRKGLRKGVVSAPSVVGMGIIQDIRKGLKQGIVPAPKVAGMGIKKAFKKGVSAVRKGVSQVVDETREEFERGVDEARERFNQQKELAEDEMRRGASAVQRVAGMGLYAGASSGRGIGMGLYAGGCMCGEGFKNDLHDVGKRYVNSGRKLVGTGHPATSSQNLDANFLMSNQMPPAYQRR